MVRADLAGLRRRAAADGPFCVALALAGAGAWALATDPDCLRAVPWWGWVGLASATALDLLAPVVGALAPRAMAGRARPPTPGTAAVIAPNLDAGPLHATLRSVRASDCSDAHVALYVDRDGRPGPLAALLAARDGRTQVLVNTDGARSSKAHGLEVLRAALPRGVTCVLQLDGGTLVRPDAPGRALQPLQDDPRVGAVSGTLRVRTESGAWLGQAQRAEFLLSLGLARPALSRLGLLWLVSGAFGAYRRAALDGVGGWTFDAGEDAVLALDLLVAGHRVVHVEEAVSYTDCPRTSAAFFRQRLRWTRTLARWAPSYVVRLLRSGRVGPAAGVALEAVVALVGPIVWALGLLLLLQAGLVRAALALLAIEVVVHAVISTGLLILANRRLAALGHVEDVVPLWTGLLLPFHAEVHRLARLSALVVEGLCLVPGAMALAGEWLHDPFMPEHVAQHDVRCRREKLGAGFARLVSWVRRRWP